MAAHLDYLELSQRTDKSYDLRLGFNAAFTEEAKRDMIDRLRKIRIDTPRSSPAMGAAMGAYSDAIAQSSDVRPYGDVYAVGGADNMFEINNIAQSSCAAIAEKALDILSTVGMVNQSERITHMRTIQAKVPAVETAHIA